MSTFTLSDLAALPTPEIIESISYDTVLAARVSEFVSRCAAAGIDYSGISVESDPGGILLQEAAYREILLRARGNDIAREAYIYFADGASLDHLAAFYDVVRMAGETDERLKVRIILAIQGRSTGGTRARYKSIAMGSSTRVADAEVYTEGVSPVVKIAVFAADNNGVADAALLSTVSAAVKADDARMVNDTIDVRSAVVQVVNVVADVWLLPSTSESVVSAVAAGLPALWAAESGLGRDLTHSWLISKIMAGGVQRVSILSPSADVVVSQFTAARIGTVTLNLRGRDF